MDDMIFRDAEAGNPYARLGLGYMYHHGKGVEQDSDLAMRWYTKSAEKGCSRAKWELAKIFRDGTIAEKDDANFLYYLTKAADAGIPEARAELALAYIEGRIVPKDEKKAFMWMRTSADQRFPIAQFLTGFMAGHGIGTDRDRAEEERWYSKLSVTGDADLFYWIGARCESGLFGIPPDIFEAARWYKSGADMGHEKCMICWRSVLDYLGGDKSDLMAEREMRFSRTISEREKAAVDEALHLADRLMDAGDDRGAFENYEKAALGGSPVALFTLALMYHDGFCVKRNDHVAMDLMMKAAFAGSEDAQFTIGSLYEAGRGLKKDPTEAIRYYTMAAAYGQLAAFYRLGRYMEHPEMHVRNSGINIIR